MKKWLKVGIVLALVSVLVGGALTCAPKAASPEDTVESFFSCFEKKDVNGMMDLIVEEIREEETIEYLKEILEQVDEIDISNLTTELISETEDEAKVKATYDMKIVVGDEELEEKDVVSPCTLKKVNGKWLISDME